MNLQNIWKKYYKGNEHLFIKQDGKIYPIVSGGQRSAAWFVRAENPIGTPLSSIVTENTFYLRFNFQNAFGTTDTIPTINQGFPTASRTYLDFRDSGGGGGVDRNWALSFTMEFTGGLSGSIGNPIPLESSRDSGSFEYMVGIFHLPVTINGFGTGTISISTPGGNTVLEAYYAGRGNTGGGYFDYTARSLGLQNSDQNLT